MLQTSSSTPIDTNAMRQLPCTTHQNTSGVATPAPIDEPMLNQPVAIERSLAGNHSEVALRPEGMPAASVRPSMPRNTASEIQPLAAPCSMHAPDHAMAKS